MDERETAFALEESATLVALEEEFILVDVGHRRFYRLNDSSYAILRLLESSAMTLEELSKALEAMYPTCSSDDLRQAVAAFIREADERGIVKRTQNLPESAGTVARCEQPTPHPLEWKAPVLIPEGEIECVIGQVTQRLAELNPAQPIALLPRALQTSPKFSPLRYDYFAEPTPIE